MSLGRILFYLISVTYFCFVVFGHLGDYQLELYDEGRRGVSALEMYQGKSHPLVPTYAGLPEHWGTKPPLLIWLQTAFVALLGPTELAIRMPAAVATLLAIGLLAWFSFKQWGTAIVGVLAGYILLSNWNFVGSHGARSGDFDAMLLLFTLGQVLFYYRWIQTGQTRSLYLAAGALVLAGWTKGIAGCLFLPAIGLWTIIDPQARKQLLNWRLYFAFGLALLMVGSYYVMRQLVDPGFLEIVWNNELGGRYLKSSEGHLQPWYHYLEVLHADAAFFPFVLLVFPGALVLFANRKHRSLALLLGLAGLGFLAIISSSATKLFWYVVPMLPYVSLLAAWLLFELGNLVGNTLRRFATPYRWLAVTLLVGAFFLNPAWQISRKVLNPEDYLGLKSQLSYREGIQHPDFEPPFTVLTPNYHANARFYVEQQKIRGRDIDIQPITPVNPPRWTKAGSTAVLQAGQRVMVCENDSWIWMATNYHAKEIKEISPCKLMEITGPI